MSAGEKRPRTEPRPRISANQVSLSAASLFIFFSLPESSGAYFHADLQSTIQDKEMTFDTTAFGSDILPDVNIDNLSRTETHSKTISFISTASQQRHFSATLT